jgi:hypothetical protein
MRWYASGWQATNKDRELAVIRGGSLKYRCFSFTMLTKLPGMGSYYVPGMEQAYQACLENNVGIMMDSGVIGYRYYKLKAAKARKEFVLDDNAFIDAYVKYAKANRKKWDFYVTVDFAVNAQEILERQGVLEKLGIRPVPVFHGDQSVDFLKRYADKGYKLIAIGSPPVINRNLKDKRRYLDLCFNEGEKLGLKFHGLAMTAVWQITAYAFWSIDSSSWSRAASTGCIMRFDPHTARMSVLHISDRVCKGRGMETGQGKRLVGMLRSELKAEGYDYDELATDFVPRHVYNAASMGHLVSYANKRQGGFELLF